MDAEQRTKLIENFKRTVEFTYTNTSFFNSDADLAKIEGKEEIMSLFFSPTEIQRFKNEARVHDDEDIIAIMDEFEALLNKAVRQAGFNNDNPLTWDKESVLDVVDLFSRWLKEDGERERFEVLANKAVEKLQ